MSVLFHAILSFRRFSLGNWKLHSTSPQLLRTILQLLQKGMTLYVRPSFFWQFMQSFWSLQVLGFFQGVVFVSTMFLNSKFKIILYCACVDHVGIPMAAGVLWDAGSVSCLAGYIAQ